MISYNQPPAILVLKQANQTGKDRFCIMLSDAVVHSWGALPFNRAVKLQYRLYFSGRKYVASVGTFEKSDILFWKESESGKFVVIVPCSEVENQASDSLTIGGTTFKLVSSWSSGPPNID